MRAENKSPATIACYTDATTRYLTWCTEQQQAPMSRAALNTWVSGMLTAGLKPSTARTRQMSVRRFASWLTEGGDLPAYPFPGVKAPHVEPPLVQPLTDDELRALIRTCHVPDGAADEDLLHHRRDEAIIRLMLETAIRSGEVIALQVDDVDLDGWLITIRRGKGGRGRVIPIGLDTALAIERYLAVRQRHRLATSSALWPGGRGKAYGQDGLIRSLKRRAARAGIATFRPHRLRHTAAHRLARSRRLRVRSDGDGRMDAQRDAHPLYPRPRFRTRRRGGLETQPRRPLIGATNPSDVAAHGSPRR